MVGLRYWVELLQRGPHDPGRPVPPDWTFRSGDRVRLHFESNVPGHIALYQVGSSGAASLLYPAPSAGQIGVPLAPHRPCAVPEGEAWFRFDARPGVEQLLVIFASRLEQLEGLKLAPRMSPSETNELRRTTLAMKGSKDLVLETERQIVAELGTFAISLRGKAIVLPIDLLHE